jgi:hypothetical protein
MVLPDFYSRGHDLGLILDDNANMGSMRGEEFGRCTKSAADIYHD